MNTTSLEKKFEKIGARLKVSTIPEPTLQRGQRFTGGLPASEGVRINVLKDKEGTYFDIRRGSNVDVEVLDVRPGDRHLLLMTRNSEGKSKFLCGADERDFFTAAIPESSSASNVPQAMEALKPGAVLSAQGKKKIKTKDKKRRKTEAYVRQGEWFFTKTPNLKVDEKLILKNEPLRRGRAKPHMAEFLYRTGGVPVYTNFKHPNGLTAIAYAALSPDERKNGHWRQMVRDPQVYVKGAIRHSDHRTLKLDGWHEVHINTEGKSRAMRSVAFLD
jgi:hypothetical protein